MVEPIGYREVDTRHRTHLTIRWGRYVESNQVPDHNQERGEARKRIKLLKEQISSRVTRRKRERCPMKAPETTDPYRPPVGLTSSDDAPLVIKRSEELPSGNDPCESESCDTK